jgi:hypothetical protein
MSDEINSQGTYRMVSLEVPAQSCDLIDDCFFAPSFSVGHERGLAGTIEKLTDNVYRLDTSSRFPSDGQNEKMCPHHGVYLHVLAVHQEAERLHQQESRPGQVTEGFPESLWLGNTSLEASIKNRLTRSLTSLRLRTSAPIFNQLALRI